ncbi:MAG: PHP-associated domain-containing protein [Halobacteria archaeon]
MRPVALLGIAAAALAASLALSAAYDGRGPTVVTVDGLRLACGDMHTHLFPSFDARVHPHDFLATLQRRNNDFVVVTDHNTAFGGDLVKWWGGLAGFPILVITGEEVTTASWHVGALGIRTTVSRWLPLNETLEEIRRQGGIAIINHPAARYHRNVLPVFENGKADGYEWVNTAVAFEGKHREVEEFTAILQGLGLYNDTLKIGVSDSHFADGLGEATTCVLVPELTEAEVLKALRERRNAVAWEGRFHAQEPWASKLNANPEALEKIRFDWPLPAQAAALVFIALMAAALFLRRV